MKAYALMILALKALASGDVEAYWRLSTAGALVQAHPERTEELVAWARWAIDRWA